MQDRIRFQRNILGQYVNRINTQKRLIDDVSEGLGIAAAFDLNS